LKNLKVMLFAPAILLLGACASAPKERPQGVPEPTNVTLEELNTAIEGGVKIQNERGEEMICRREAKTGSRLARETICMTQAEWVKVSEESQRATKKSMRQGKIPHGT
jgi:hypothetical protein